MLFSWCSSCFSFGQLLTWEIKNNVNNLAAIFNLKSKTFVRPPIPLKNFYLFHLLCQILCPCVMCTFKITIVQNNKVSIFNLFFPWSYWPNLYGVIYAPQIFAWIDIDVLDFHNVSLFVHCFHQMPLLLMPKTEDEVPQLLGDFFLWPL